ncbi:uncharacterized protein LOC144179969 [Haemaphysalis longicornis]
MRKWLVTIDRLNESLEARLPLPEAARRRLSRIYAGIMLLLVIEVVDQDGRLAMRYLGKASSALQVIGGIISIAGALVTMWWGYLPQTGVAICTWMAAAYVAQINSQIQSRVDRTGESFVFRWGEPSGLAELKQDLRLVRRLLAASQNAFQAGLLTAHVASMGRLCVAFYYAVTDQFGLMPAYAYVLYVGYMTAHALVSAKGADSVVAEVGKLKELLSTGGYYKHLKLPAQQELQVFLQALEPERYRFNIWGLYSLETRALSKATGTVLTYTIILIQTSIYLVTPCKK